MLHDHACAANATHAQVGSGTDLAGKHNYWPLLLKLFRKQDGGYTL